MHELTAILGIAAYLTSARYALAGGRRGGSQTPLLHHMRAADGAGGPRRLGCVRGSGRSGQHGQL